MSGRPGTIGDRAGNFVVQSADLLLILGSRLNIRQVSYNWQSFAREAYKIWVDIDEAELQEANRQSRHACAGWPVRLDSRLLRQAYAGPTAGAYRMAGLAREERRTLPGSAARILGTMIASIPIRFMDSCSSSWRRRPDRRHRQWQRLRGQLPGRRDQEGPAAVDQLRLRHDGLRSARRDRRHARRPAASLSSRWPATAAS
jgi:hypothetical protein